jgi:hypothetical protein
MEDVIDLGKPFKQKTLKKSAIFSEKISALPTANMMWSLS